MDGKIISRVIRCTESNAAEFLGLVNGWPELRALVRALRAEPDLFPGLRGMQITLTGTPEWVAKGMGAINEENARIALGASDAT
ncbi:hypothetical protein QTI51_04025 [Variovorax sp. J22G73]|uniref:hypothetical protein n=1 Tax=unclassified Variovorax TaxID=663243 RepID=UPI00257883F1|nr:MULTISPECIES: hypothetical protein [unclassified Variovorax]MDM0003904.1 hypothetical protein [Variovorax sp. J22R203]MDM0096430.1 hypothetical protein [Variovorax sp. J22G73]